MALLTAAYGGGAMAAGQTTIETTASLDRTRIERGQRLLEGREPLPARIVGHETRLPATAARCTNCHLRDDRRNAAGGASLAPPLGRATLLRMSSRRGGPPSSYDAESFCRVLRTGVDPAFVTLPKAMPRYDISSAQCDALWALMAGTERIGAVQP
ncbi:MAG TPA: hypothetical protein PKA20_23595 [Burkholderiaceae bacterium]|nr:hypothetical protein [Burkholderiaceae bacterium]